MKPLALVVENDAGTRRLLEALLNRSAIETDVVSRGRDALLLLKHVEYSVILLDLFIDAVTGFDILSFLAESQANALDRSLVLSSANERQLEYVRARFPGVQVIRKPFDIEELLTAVSARIAEVKRSGDLHEAFCRRSVVAGANAGVVAVVESNQIVYAATHFGYPPGLVESFWPLPVETQYPLCAAIRNMKPVWIASINLATSEYPLLAPVEERGVSKALAAIPLVRDGVVIGAAGWSFHQPRVFADAERRAFLAIAESLTPRLDDQAQSTQNAHA